MFLVDSFGNASRRSNSRSIYARSKNKGSRIWLQSTDFVDFVALGIFETKSAVAGWMSDVCTKLKLTNHLIFLNFYSYLPF